MSKTIRTIDEVLEKIFTKRDGEFMPIVKEAKAQLKELLLEAAPKNKERPKLEHPLARFDYEGHLTQTEKDVDDSFDQAIKEYTDNILEMF